MSAYYTDQLTYHRQVLDEFAEGRSEWATVKVPPRAGAVDRSIPVQGVFAPSPSDQTMTTLGVKAPLNGIFYVRVSHLPEALGVVTRSAADGSMPAGYTLTVRGRTMRVTRAIYSDGEVLFGLQDKLEG